MKFGTIFTVALLVVSASTGSAYINLNESPMVRDQLVTDLQNHPEVTTLDQVPGILRPDFLMNFILKHGLKRQGERGHLVETKVSQSADPDAPRAIIFDERSGFTVSYNGGKPNQTAGQRLDIMSFETHTNTFSLEQIDFPIEPGQPHLKTSDCKMCHGPGMRPIFAMYPDWPAFYGSDNDELTRNTEVQKAELKNYRTFLDTVANVNPRYSPLFESEHIEQRLGLRVYPTFPYRQDVSEIPTAVSRAFAFRPSLRAGVIYNRLATKATFQKIKTHRNYQKFAAYFLFNAFECDPSSSRVQMKWAKQVQDATGKAPVLHGARLDYLQLLSLFDLRINDIDIRYSYNHPGYANRDAKTKIMEVGYIGDYYNSYFDGSATTNELLSALIFKDLALENAHLRGLANPEGLAKKYRPLTARFSFDKDFFESADSLGEWLPIPYAKEVAAPQHRERYTTEMASQHRNLCDGIETIL
jgi:hypothetical protein